MNEHQIEAPWSTATWLWFHRVILGLPSRYRALQTLGSVTCSRRRDLAVILFAPCRSSSACSCCPILSSLSLLQIQLLNAPPSRWPLPSSQPAAPLAPHSPCPPQPSPLDLPPRPPAAPRRWTRDRAWTALHGNPRNLRRFLLKTQNPPSQARGEDCFFFFFPSFFFFLFLLLLVFNFKLTSIFLQGSSRN